MRKISPRVIALAALLAGEWVVGIRGAELVLQVGIILALAAFRLPLTD